MNLKLCMNQNLALQLSIICIWIRRKIRMKINMGIRNTAGKYNLLFFFIKLFLSGLTRFEAL